MRLLYLIEILHQTTTVQEGSSPSPGVVSYRNSTSNHNFRALVLRAFSVVSYRNSTSNHNSLLSIFHLAQLYLIEILHQTTTVRDVIVPLSRVVSYRNSTSNHNCRGQHRHQHRVVSYRNSTSNHNDALDGLLVHLVVSYRNSTSNHNSQSVPLCPCTVVSYRNSTSNHNPRSLMLWSTRLYLIEILHQTTTLRGGDLQLS